MELDPNKFKVDESRSNPMVAAMQYLDCPSGREICAYVIVGFGSIAEQCEYFKSDPKTEQAECLFEKKD
jgi:hypothetical protein